MKPGWLRYRSRDRCAVCGHGGHAGHGSGCVYAGPIENPTAVLCLRIQEGSVKEAVGGMGWVHKLRRDPNWVPPPRLEPTKEATVNPRMAELADQFERAITADDVEGLADSLGVTVAALRALRVGWAEDYLDTATGELLAVNAFSFPMRAAGNLVIGIRFRNANGQKWAARGSVNGLFIPRNVATTGPLYVVEGPTDTAAMLSLGLPCIGRPSNTAGLPFIVEYAKRFLPRRMVIILRNNDAPGSDAERMTLAGAENLKAALECGNAACGVNIAVPPCKDIRDWLRQGCTKSSVEELCLVDI